MADLGDAIQNIWSSDYVQKNPNKAYKVSYADEYAAVAAYVNGGPRPDPATFSKLGKGLVEAEDVRREIEAPEPEPTPPGVAPPKPPAAYSVPAGATAVSTTAQLISAMSGAAKDIVLEDGTYDNGSPVNNTGGYRIYARNLLGATIKFGFNLGGSGPVFRGLKFDTVAGGKLPGDNSQIFGGATNLQVLDCVFAGNWSTKYGVRSTNPQGLVCERLRFTHFRDVALRASNNVHAAYPGGSTPHITRITDIFAEGISYDPPGSSNGVAEAAVWIGHPVDNPVERLDLRDVGRKAMETVSSSRDTIFRDFYLDMTGPHAQAGGIGVGCYLEHNNYYNTYEKFLIVGVNRGFNGEWNENVAGNAGAQHCTIRNGTVDANGWTRGGNTAGVYLDTGCDSNTVTGCTFKNQNWAGVGAHNNIGVNVFEPNTYQMKPGAVPLRTTHFYS